MNTFTLKIEISFNFLRVDFLDIGTHAHLCDQTGDSLGKLCYKGNEVSFLSCDWYSWKTGKLFASYLSGPLPTACQPVPGEGDLSLAARGESHHHHQQHQGDLQSTKSGGERKAMNIFKCEHKSSESQNSRWNLYSHVRQRLFY